MSSEALSFRELTGATPTSASPTDSTLLIIDAQNEYIFGRLATSNIDSTRPAISSLLSRYRANASPKHIIHILHRTPAGAPVFTPGTNLADEFPELAPQEGEKVVWKEHPGAFTGTGLEDYLRSLGPEGVGAKKVVLVGYMAHVCVSTTARQAAELGFEVVVARQAVGDRDIPGTGAEVLVEVVLSELADCFGTVVDVDSIV